MTGLFARQLTLRKSRVTGYSAPGLFGFSPYGDPERCWEEHTGLREVVQNDGMEAGNELEGALGAWAWKSLGVTDGAKPTMGWLRDHAPQPYYHKVMRKYLWGTPSDEGVTLLDAEYHEAFAATPDQISFSQGVGMQIKNHSPEMRRTYTAKDGATVGPLDDAIPLHIRMQCLWERAVTESIWGRFDAWLLVAYFGGGDRRVIWIGRDHALVEGMRKAGLIFWRQHLDPAGPRTPPVDWPWKAQPAKERRVQKLSRRELAVAPVPFSGADPLAVPIPFMEERK